MPSVILHLLYSIESTLSDLGNLRWYPQDPVIWLWVTILGSNVIILADNIIVIRDIIILPDNIIVVRDIIILTDNIIVVRDIIILTDNIIVVRDIDKGTINSTSFLNNIIICPIYQC